MMWYKQDKSRPSDLEYYATEKNQPNKKGLMPRNVREYKASQCSSSLY